MNQYDKAKTDELKRKYIIRTKCCLAPAFMMGGKPTCRQCENSIDFSQLVKFTELHDGNTTKEV
jgi:hypothetical protein